MTWSKNILFSNYHRVNRWLQLDVSYYRDNNMNIIMDSWLFTMMFGCWKQVKRTEQDLWNYMEQYIKDMHKMDRYWTIVEMDVHKVLWVDKLQRFRDYFKKNRPLERILFVYHVEEGIEGLKKLARTCPYIALSIPELRIVYRGKVEEAVNHLLWIINKENPSCRVHLLWCTQVNLLKRKWYYSCDSSSWLMGNRYWDVYKFDKGKLSKVKYNFRKMNMTEILKKFNLPLYKNDYFNVSILNGFMFTKMEEYINRMYYNTK